MKKTLLFLICLFALVARAGPTRDAGLSLHMLPDRVAKLAGEAGGFTITDPATGQRGQTYSEISRLVAYIESIPDTVRQNGVWIVYTHPRSYGSEEKERLRELIEKMKAKNVRVFTCRASELPSRAWKEGKGIDDEK